MIRRTYLLILIVFISSIYISSANAQFAIQPPTVNIPPTNAYNQFNVSNATISAKNFIASVNIVGKNGLGVTGSNSSQTIYLTAPNPSSGLPTTYCPANFGFVSYNATTNILACALLNQTGSGSGVTSLNSLTGALTIAKGTNINSITAAGNTITINAAGWQNNTGSNLGTSGSGVFASMSGSILQFLKLISSNSFLSITTNSTNVIFNIPSIVTKLIAGTGISVNQTSGNILVTNTGVTKLAATSPVVVNASTGQVNVSCPTCSTTTGTITGSANAGKATGSVGVLSTPTTTLIKGRNMTGTSPIVVTKTNDTDIAISCPTCSSTTGTITGGSNIGTSGFGFFKNSTNNNINLRNLTTSRSDLFTITQSSNNVNLASSFKSNTIACTNQFISAFTNSTGIYTCATPTNTAQVVSADNGVSLISSQFNATETKLKSLRNSTAYVLWNHNTTSITPSFQFKINTKACTNNQFISAISNSSDSTCNKMLLNAVSKTNSYTVASTDDIILVNATGGNYTITIPTIATMSTGKELMIKKIDYSNNYIEIVPTSSTIDYFTNLNMTNPMDTLLIDNNGTTWFKKTPIQSSIAINSLKNTVNSYYGSWNNQGTPTTLAVTNNTLYAIPFKLDRTTSLSTIQSEVTTAGSASNCRMALYSDYNGYPYNKISGSDVGALTTQTRTTRTIINNFTSDIHLPEGRYFNALDCNAGTVVNTITTDVITSSTTAGASTSATQTFTITIGSNTNRILVVPISYGKGASTPNTNNAVISSVAIGGTSFTKAVNFTRNNATANFALDSEIWYLVNPPTGLQTVTITPVTTASYYMITGGYSLYNVHQTTPIGITSSNGTTTRTSSISGTPTHTNAWLIENIFGIDTAGGLNEAIPQAPSNTQAWNSITGANQVAGASQYKTNPIINSANKMTWNWALPAANRQNTADVLIELNPPAVSSLPVFRAIPASSLAPYLGMINTMGATNGNTMYTTSHTMGTSSPTALPSPFYTNATLSTSSVPEILLKNKG